MLLDKILNPRWKHKNPQVRKRALLSLDPSKEESQKIFLEVLAGDPELYLRRIAIQRLTNVGKLQEIRESGEANEIIEEATNRLCKLLATVDKQHPVSYLKNKLSNISETRILEYVALHTNDQELQSIAVEKIANESVLIEVLNTTKFASNKKHALTKISSINSLKRAIKILKRKDNDLASLAQSMLDKAIEDRKLVDDLQKEIRRSANEILELLNLCKFSGEWLKYKARFLQLKGRYQELASELASRHSDIPDSKVADVEQAFIYFEQQLAIATENQTHAPDQDANQSTVPAQVRPAEIDELERCEKELQEFLAQLSQTKISETDTNTSDYAERAAEIKRKWNDACSRFARDDLNTEQLEEFEKLQSALGSIQGKVEKQLQDLDRVVKYISATASLNAQARTLLEKQQDFDVNRAQRLLDKYQSSGTQQSCFISGEFLGETQHYITELTNRTQAFETAMQKLSDEFESLVEKLDVSLVDGKAKTVKPLINRGRNILKQLTKPYISRLDKKGLSKRFNQQLRQADSLLGWQQWSSSSVKEKLVASMQKLADLAQENADNPDFDFTRIADEISKAREQWKQASAGTARDESLWEKFDTACNKAYQPCKRYFDQHNQERKQNLRAREKVCQDLEKYAEGLQKMSSEDIDWKATDKIIQVARQDWKNLGEVKRKDWESVNKRFRNVLSQLEKLIRQHRDENSERKQQMINRVNALAKQLQEKSVELETAIEDVKQLQAQWKQIGAANKDKQLWETFRSACNAVFDVRKSVREQEKQQEAEIDQQRDEFIQNVNRCADLDGEELLQARSAVDQLLSDWRSLPKLKKGHKLQRRFDDACKGFRNKIQQFHDGQLRKLKQMLQQNVAACFRLETSINHYFDGGKSAAELEQEMSSIDQQWNLVSDKSLKFSKSIEQRFNELKNMISELIAGNSESLKQGILDQQEIHIKNKEDLCIQLEILANKESPEASKQRRLELQVAQLANTMKQVSSPDVTTGIQSLLSQWHTSGFILSPDSENYERRFYSALESLDKDYQYPI